MTAYYNEIDPYAAQWLRNLIKAGHIAPGDVDERSIVDVRADDLRGYAQCHFFAGIGGWSIALRLAGWPDDRPVWTGSCPCQPFSAAGKGAAADDERHLWPAWFPLIAKCRPPTVFGEQVEAAVGWGWVDSVFSDLEGEGYACGTTVLPACGVGAPHIRQRLWFMADAQRGTAERRRYDLADPSGGTERETWERQRFRDDAGASGKPRQLANTDGGDASAEREQRSGEHGQRAQDGGTGELDYASEQGLPLRSGQPIHGSEARSIAQRSGAVVVMGNAESIERERRQPDPSSRREGSIRGSGISSELADSSSRREERPPISSREGLSDDDGRGQTLDLADAAGRGFGEFGDATQPRRGGHDDGGGVLNGFWRDAEWIACTDGKARPVGPGSFPLGHGIQRRASKLRAYGNAIVPQVAAEFIMAACGDH